MEGTIIKGIGGFYYVKTNEEVIECKARGIFRLNELTPMVGDKVEITVNNNKGLIEKIHERSNKLIRPAVANVTQAFVVFTLKNPDLNPDLLNKFLVSCEYNNIKSVVCLNKIDLVEDIENNQYVDMLKSAGYDIMLLKAKEGYGIEQLKEKLKDNITVFCGPSGVGKSTILNNLMGKEVMKTGDISEKVGRGKHTTRHSELVEAFEGYIVDTPGFSSMDINFIEEDELQFCFPEFTHYKDKCKFRGCLHYKETNCAVKNAVDEEIIVKERYAFYTKTLEELIKTRRNKYD